MDGLWYNYASMYSDLSTAFSYSASLAGATYTFPVTATGTLWAYVYAPASSANSWYVDGTSRSFTVNTGFTWQQITGSYSLTVEFKRREPYCYIAAVYLGTQDPSVLGLTPTSCCELRLYLVAMTSQAM